MFSLEKIKGVVFDLDGVLIDTEGLQIKAWIKVLKDYGIFLPEVSEKDLLSFRGKSAEFIASQLKKRYGLKVQEKELVRKRDKYILKVYQKREIKLMPQAKEALKFFRFFYQIALASTGSKKEILIKLEKSSLKKYFPVIVSREDVKRGKPAPDIYLKAVKKLKLKPQNCLAIEDTQYGVESAKSAGLFCFAIPNNFSKNQDFSKADKIFHSLKEVVSWFKKEKNFLILWDFDGTLIDTMKAHTKLASEVISKHFQISKEKAKDKYRQTTGLPFEKQLELIFPEKEKERAKCAIEYHQRKLREVYLKAKPIKGAKRTLIRLKKLGFGQFILSGTEEWIVKKWLKENKISRVGVLGKEKGIKKDHLEILRKKFPREKFVLISDSLKDLLLPVEVKIGFYKNKREKDWLFKAKPDFLIKNLEKVENILENIL